jgi:hypothetical protein
MEALAIVLVVVVAAIVFVVTWFGVRNGGAQNPILGRAQLEEYREALREKTLRAQREQWDAEMVGRLADQLAEVEERLGRMEKRAA